MNMTQKTRKLTTVGMLCALAFIVMTIGRIPVVMFLKYDPKDVIIAIGGFIYGPFTAFLISLIVGFIEMITVSDTGIIGFIMNVLGSAAFASTAAYIYKKQHTLKGAVLGLITGCVAMTAIMILWNYLITPLYMNVERAQVAGMLVPVFLPFNLVKSVLNAGITMLLYKPVVNALRKTGLIELGGDGEKKKGLSVGIMLISALVIATCVLFILVLSGKI